MLNGLPVVFAKVQRAKTGFELLVKMLLDQYWAIVPEAVCREIQSIYTHLRSIDEEVRKGLVESSHIVRGRERSSVIKLMRSTCALFR
jgi:hypothetical protein